MKTILGLMACALAGAALAQTPTGNAEAAKAKTSMCEGCHAVPGYRTASPHVYRVPKLGGQQALYLANALQEYKSGARSHPTMQAIALSLSEQDMADLAAYYSSVQK